MTPSAFRYISEDEAMWVMVLFPATIFTIYVLAVGPSDGQTLRDLWFYKDYESALTAFREWDTEKDPEPNGWVQHPETRRRRYPDGDPASEEKW